MGRIKRYLRFWLLALFLCCGNPSPLFAITPLERVKATIDRVLNILESPLNPDGTKTPQRNAMLRQALESLFDFSAMARMSLGTHWEYQADRQREFVSLFTDFMENVYLAKMESLKDTEVVYVRERVERGLAQVDTKVVPTAGEDIPVNYRLHWVGREWKIYDVLIQNVSVVENYRAQFHRILKVTSFDELLKKLQERLPERGG